MDSRRVTRLSHLVVAVLLTVWCLFLSFWRLDSVELYRDEADAALVAGSMVQTGHWIPSYFDGRQLLLHAPDGSDSDTRFVPVPPGWLQFYVEAASIRVLGTGTWQARFPFALLCPLAMLVLYAAGRQVLPKNFAWLLPLFGVTSVFTLFAFRQSRYYGLVYLFSALLLYELCRYLRRPELAASPAFYVRLGLWGLLLDLSHWGSFAAMWIALSVLVLLRAPSLFRRRWIILTAALAIPVSAEFYFIHSGFLQQSRASATFNSYLVRYILKLNTEALWSIVPFIFLAIAIVLIRARRVKVAMLPPVAAKFAAAFIAITIVVTTLMARGSLEPRYYLEILPALALLEASVVVLLIEGRRSRAAALVAVGCLIWPNLTWNSDWSDDLISRQFSADRTYREPLIDYLAAHVQPGQTIQVFPNQEGQPVHFYLPQARWVGQLDSRDSHNLRYRPLVPADAFDDYPGVDWLVIWRNPLAEVQPSPRNLTPAYHKVWEHHFVHNQSVWDRWLWNPILTMYRGSKEPGIDGYEVWQRGSTDSIAPREQANSILSRYR